MSNPTLAAFKVPAIDNEPMVRSYLIYRSVRSIDTQVQRSYAPGSAERNGLEAAISQMEQELPFEVPCIVNGQPVSHISIVQLV